MKSGWRRGVQDEEKGLCMTSKAGVRRHIGRTVLVSEATAREYLTEANQLFSLCVCSCTEMVLYVHEVANDSRVLCYEFFSSCCRRSDNSARGCSSNYL